MSIRPGLLRPGAALCALVLACACTDRHPLATAPLPPQALASMECRVDVGAQALSCVPPVQPLFAGGARMDRMVGGQDVYVKLASPVIRYDAGTGLFELTVTVQNLMKDIIGTPDGSTVTGVDVFFAIEPTASGGTGTIEILNETGADLFTRANQPYFRYDEILTPYQVSQPKTWQFGVPNTVTGFRFSVYISAAAVTTGTSLVDRVWSGLASTDWWAPGNWAGGVAPDATSTVAVPPDALLASPNMPVLSADAGVLHLRVGTGSTLGLGGFTLQAGGNVDAVGTVGADGGTLWMSGAGALLQGRVGALRVSGGTKLQGATRATGAVTVTNGTLTTNGQPLSISLP